MITHSTETKRELLADFVDDSNRIEGIYEITDAEVDAHHALLELDQLSVTDIEVFVYVVAAVYLRSAKGMDVRVGSHYPPQGGHGIRKGLSHLLKQINNHELTPYEAHVAYETLHPFMDGNGRSGRAVWMWHMQSIGADPFSLPFLHRWYYQSLDSSRGQQ